MFNSIWRLFERPIDPQLIVGTWKDQDADCWDIFTADNRVISMMNQRITDPFNEEGLIGTLSVHVNGLVYGRWSLRGRKLTVIFEVVENLTFGEISLDCKIKKFSVIGILSALGIGEFGEEFMQKIQSELKVQLQQEAPKLLAGFRSDAIIQSISNDKLVTRSSSGETEVQIRIATKDTSCS